LLPYKFGRLYFPCVISHVQKSNCYNVVTKPRTRGRGSDKKIGELLLPFQFHTRHQILKREKWDEREIDRKKNLG